MILESEFSEKKLIIKSWFNLKLGFWSSCNFEKNEVYFGYWIEIIGSWISMELFIDKLKLIMFELQTSFIEFRRDSACFRLSIARPRNLEKSRILKLRCEPWGWMIIQFKIYPIQSIFNSKLFSNNLPLSSKFAFYSRTRRNLEFENLKTIVLVSNPNDQLGLIYFRSDPPIAKCLLLHQIDGLKLAVVTSGALLLLCPGLLSPYWRISLSL